MPACAANRANRSIKISVQAPNAMVLAAEADRAVGLMRLVRGLQPEDANDVEVTSNDSLIAAFDQVAGVSPSPRL